MMTSDQLSALLGPLGDNEINLRRLKKQISTPLGVIPFVGAGLSIPLGFKSWSEFLLDQASRGGIEPEIARMLAAGDYEQAGEAVLTNRGHRAFLNAIDVEYGDTRLQSIRLCGAVDALPLLARGPVITTNFDHVLERAFETAGVGFEHVVWGARATSVHTALTQDRHFLLKLHGDVDEQDDRVLTHADYEKYYGSNSPLCQVLQSLFIARPVLFVGCNLGSDRWVQLLRKVAVTNSAMEHFALVEYPMTDDEYPQRQRFLSDHGISPIWFPHARYDLIETILKSLSPTTVLSTSPVRRNRPINGPTDQLLAHATGLLGRVNEVTAVLQFLHGADCSCVETAQQSPKILIVTGSPGIGKSEVCKEALQQFLRDQPTARAYYVELEDVRKEGGLLARIAEAFNLQEATFNRVYAAIAAQPCLIYLDNLEDMLADQDALDTLRKLVGISDLYVLASSREHVAQLGRELLIHQLDQNAAVELFMNEWNRRGPHPPLTASVELHEFVATDLDRHALSIVLVAAQAYQTASLHELIARWRDEAMRLARLPRGHERLTSLDVSLERSLAAAQSESAEAVTLWGLCALFPEGMSAVAFDAVTKGFEDNGFQAREMLLRLNIIRFPQSNEVGDEVVRTSTSTMTILMLAPLRRFILEKAQEGTHGLRIDRLLDTTMAYFLGLATAAKETELDDNGTTRGKALDQLLPELSNLREAVALAAQRGTHWGKTLRTLSRVLSNSYHFRPLVSIDILHVLLLRQRQEPHTADVAHTLRLLADMEDRLGDIDHAREHHMEALKLLTEEKNGLGLAYVLTSLGDQEIRLGDVDQARKHYMEALKLFTQERDDLGLAHVLTSLGDLENHLGDVDQTRRYYEEAMRLLKQKKDNLGLGNVLASLGNLESRLGDVTHAREHFAEAMMLFAQQRSNLGLANTLRGLGDLELALGQLQQADIYYGRARGLYAAEHEPMGLAFTCAELARVAHALNQPEQAEQYLHEGMRAAQTSNVPMVAQYVAQAAAEIHPGPTKPDDEPGE